MKIDCDENAANSDCCCLVVVEIPDYYCSRTVPFAVEDFACPAHLVRATSSEEAALVESMLVAADIFAEAAGVADAVAAIAAPAGFQDPLAEPVAPVAASAAQVVGFVAFGAVARLAVAAEVFAVPLASFAFVADLAVCFLRTDSFANHHSASVAFHRQEIASLSEAFVAFAFPALYPVGSAEALAAVADKAVASPAAAWLVDYSVGRLLVRILAFVEVVEVPGSEDQGLVLQPKGHCYPSCPLGLVSLFVP